ncbi:MAG: hypothetical protein KAH95_10290, partial [Spirochaetales bacterium]|nr:hypothetical protein [Spirochaetales bacterium]
FSEITSLNAGTDGLCYDRADGFFYYYDGIVIRNNNGFVKDTGVISSLQGAMVVYSNERKIFFHSYNGATTHKLYSMGLNGTDMKQIFTNDIGIGGFDILSK